MTTAATAGRPAGACENCGTWLQGGYCHLCGQSAHNPTRHFGHAVEEIFESFWHLDGRVFRTLRDIFVPGRVANAYLAGHRVRYIAPLRMFVVLTALTLFAARLVMMPEVDPAPQGAAAAAADAPRSGIEVSFANVDSIGAVERERAGLLQGLDAADTPRALGPVMAEARRRIDLAADARIRELGGEPPPRDTGAGTATPESGGARSARTPSGNALADRAIANWDRLDNDPRAIAQFLFGTAPATLFVLLPLFALLLKIAYVFTGRPYLEHVVIALYSHVYLMLALLLAFVAVALAGYTTPGLPWLARALSWAGTALLLSLPLYLLWMQRRVYRQGWALTLFKFVVIGQVYTALFLLVSVGVIGFSLLAM